MNKNIDLLQKKKQQIKTIDKIIRDNHRFIDIKHANKMRSCCNIISIQTDINGNQRLNMSYPCGSPLCPVCQYLKTRKEIAKTHKIFEKIKSDTKTSSYRFYFLTLTVKDCHISQLDNEINQLNKAYNRLRKTKKWNKVVVGSSKYIHLGINPGDRIQLHLHVIIVVINSYTSYNLITKDEWSQLWKESLYEDYYPVVDCKSVGDRGDATSRDLCNLVAYGFNAVDIEDIKKYPETYAKLMSYTHGKQKSSHQGLILKLKKEVSDDYKNLNLKKVEVKSISIYLHNKNKYKHTKTIKSNSN